MSRHEQNKETADIIDNPNSLADLCALLEKETIIAFDTEFIREKTYFPEIALIQVATEKESWLIDPLKLNKNDLKPLIQIFQNPAILKVLHAAQGDQECLFLSYEITAFPTLDTAVAASLLGMGDNIGLQKLLKESLGVELEKGHARTDWTVRPLPHQLISYAHSDVKYLVKLGKTLLSDLDKKNRKDWALELCQKWEKPEAYTFDAKNQINKFAKSGRLNEKALLALEYLFEWRDQHARRVNIPRRRFVDDDVLIDLAKVRPLNKDHLGSFRGLNKGILNNFSDELLDIFQKVHDVPAQSLPKIAKPDIPTSRESRVIDVIQCFLKFLADKNNITSRHLLGNDELLKVIRLQPKTKEELLASGIISEGSYDLIGEDLLQILNGKRALSISVTPQGLDSKVVTM